MRSLIPLLLFSLCAAAPALGAIGEYPNPHLLVEPSQLLARLETQPPVVILDARSRDAYEQARIPGALHVDVGEWKSAFDGGENAEAWSQRIGKLGIQPDSRVVIYDDNRSKDAARVWWTLRYWGVENARLLNGGWKGWRAIDGPTESGEAAFPEPTSFTAKPVPQRFATKHSVLKGLAGGTLQILDSRSEQEYCGDEKLSNLRGGAIPGAKHLEWSDLIDPETHRFKSAQELQKLFQTTGVDLDRPVATHCQSGGRSSVMAFGLELMGAEQAQNYYAGWSEWGNDKETPIVKPDLNREQDDD